MAPKKRYAHSGRHRSVEATTEAKLEGIFLVTYPKSVLRVAIAGIANMTANGAMAMDAVRQDLPDSTQTSRSCLSADSGSAGSELSCLPLAEAQKYFSSAAGFHPGQSKRLKVISAYRVSGAIGQKVVSAQGYGFLPVWLKMKDGTCLALEANYDTNGRLNAAACDGRPSGGQASVAQPTNKALRFIGASWGYSAWYDPKERSTIVTAPFAKSFEPPFVAHMPVIAITAMNSPDAPLGNVSVIGRIGGKLVVIVLEVSF